MSFEPWILAAMEEKGFMNTSEGYINALAHYLSKYPTLFAKMLDSIKNNYF